MRLIKFILLSVLFFSMISCKKYLDIVPDNVATLDYAFRMRSMAIKYLFTCYSFLPKLGSKTADPALLGSDEIWIEPNNHASNQMIGRGEQNINSPFNNYWEGS